MRGVVATGLLLLDNARLVEELRASRARMAVATHEGRVRIERDLHDGVQPHLNALLLKLAIARDIAGDDELGRLLDELGDDGAAAVGSCASWRAAYTRRCCASAGSPPRWRPSPPRRR